MKICRLCRNEIQSWQSYQSDASTVAHMSCLMGKTPATAPGDRWTGDRNLMLVPAKKLITEGKAMEREDE